VALAGGSVVNVAVGCRAVFHVAVVGYAVDATAGDADSYGSGPGMV